MSETGNDDFGGDLDAPPDETMRQRKKRLGECRHCKRPAKIAASGKKKGQRLALCEVHLESDRKRAEKKRVKP